MSGSEPGRKTSGPAVRPDSVLPSPTSGEGADSALAAMLKKRQMLISPPAEPPAPAPTSGPHGNGKK
jgi:hypothetical protein